MVVDEYEQAIRTATLNDIGVYKQEQSNFQRWLLDDYEEISYLQNALRGIMIDPMTKQPNQDRSTQLLNDKGARVLTETYLLPIIKNAKLSNFEPEDINNMMLSNMQELTQHLYLKMDDYELDFENLGLVLTLFKTYLKSVFNRALYGGEQDRLGTTQKIISQERINTGPPNPYNEFNEPQRRKSIKDYMPF